MNANQILNQMMASNPNYKDNPIAQNALQMLNSGNGAGLEQLATNIAKAKGIDLDSIKRMLGV